MDGLWALALNELQWWVHDLVIVYCVLVLTSIGFDYGCYYFKKDGNRYRLLWVWLVTIWVFPLFILWLVVDLNRKPKG